jgi:dTDP-4-amino-4,6-dideoxygalactose transaminase
MIPFNKPHLTGKETAYIEEAVRSGKISGDGMFTKKCHAFFEQHYSIRKALLTTSCTDALEMSALLADIVPGDEVIVPSYTFVSTANAFVLRGAKIVFADSRSDHPGIDEDAIEALITPRTKAIVVVHYAGVACDMDKVNALAARHNLLVIEDAAQAIDSYYKGRPLGTLGHMAAFSFHETKNIQCGEGGLLAINDERFTQRAEIIREKGTNRSAFFRGEVDKYGWVDIGSSFLPSEIVAAFLYAQLENITSIQNRRKEIWNRYMEGLSDLKESGDLKLPSIPDFATNNGHMFYVLTENLHARTTLIEHMKAAGSFPVFHYLSLHKSPYYASLHKGGEMPQSDRYMDTLLRLPLFVDMTNAEADQVIDAIKSFFASR